MKLTDEQIRALVDKFISSEQAKPWREQRLTDHKKWKEWIDPIKIDSISDEELKQKFLEYFNEGAGRCRFNAIYRDRVVRDIKRFRNVMKFLLDESILVENRLDETIESFEYPSLFPIFIKFSSSKRGKVYKAMIEQQNTQKCRAFL